MEKTERSVNTPGQGPGDVGSTPALSTTRQSSYHVLRKIGEVLSGPERWAVIRWAVDGWMRATCQTDTAQRVRGPIWMAYEAIKREDLPALRSIIAAETKTAQEAGQWYTPICPVTEYMGAYVDLSPLAHAIITLAALVGLPEAA